MSENGKGEARTSQWIPGRFGWSQRQIDGRVIVHLTGELDLSTSAELRQRLTKVVESSHAAVVVLDLSGVRFIDAHTVDLIVDACEAARRRDRRLEVDGLRGITALVFGVLGIEPLLTHQVREDSAGGEEHGRHQRASGVAAGQRSAGGADGAG